jgi:hypothetical protein
MEPSDFSSPASSSLASNKQCVTPAQAHMDGIQQEILEHNARMEVHGTNLHNMCFGSWFWSLVCLWAICSICRVHEWPCQDCNRVHNEGLTKFYEIKVDDNLTPEARNAFLDFISDGQNAGRYLMSQLEADSKYWVRKQLREMNFLTNDNA